MRSSLRFPRRGVRGVSGDSLPCTPAGSPVFKTWLLNYTGVVRLAPIARHTHTEASRHA